MELRHAIPKSAVAAMSEATKKHKKHKNLSDLLCFLCLFVASVHDSASALSIMPRRLICPV